MFGTVSEPSRHRNRLNRCDRAAHFVATRKAYFTCHDEVWLFKFFEDQSDFRVLQPQAGFFRQCRVRLLEGQALKLNVAHDLQCGETIWLHGDRLVKLRRIPVMNLEDIAGLKTIARVTLGEGSGTRSNSSANRDQNEQKGEKAFGDVHGYLPELGASPDHRNRTGPGTCPLKTEITLLFTRQARGDKPEGLPHKCSPGEDEFN